ncbi:hypothetical protein JOF56_007908 [Kibdelosporangium banguiense]|uniref:Uncharacterized protein n=1 Tax=Kibdelosporangium banguiense TaxID=1365924 RepID=A0ABS4TT04_9PSEU|nr:hypothetical protein [Kibdelosporangium banguiense]MBP2327523.1 hypothetical protein [Kibdelosporangium banguiense]
MNEQELRDSLREVMVASSPPPSMNPNAALDSARRAHKRRRATFAGAAAGVAVVAMAVGTAFALSPGETPLPIDQAAQPPANTGVVGTGKDGGGTETQFPDGQTDRTARNGPQAAKGEALLQSLKAKMPSTLTVDTKATHQGDPKLPVTTSQSQFRDYINGDKNKQIWEYQATVAVTKQGSSNAGTGRVMVETVTPGGSGPTDVCDLAKNFWGIGGTCETRVVQGKTVGVVTQSKDARIDQAVAYRYEDGTTVVVAQSKQPNNAESADGPMAQPPLTLEQLAPLVLTPDFKVS